MAFFFGQRVRIKNHPYRSELVGEVFAVTKSRLSCLTGSGGEIYEKPTFNYRTPFASTNSTGKKVWVPEHWLEPVNDDLLSYTDKQEILALLPSKAPSKRVTVHVNAKG